MLTTNRPRSQAAPSAKPSPAAERRKRRRLDKRQERQRQRDGIRIARSPYDAEVLEKLIGLHYLDERDASDPCAVGEAYFAMVKQIKFP